MTGPNARATFEVPSCCTANSAVRIASVIGTTYEPSAGAATSSPSTAERTEIAGVIIPSP